MGRKSEVDIPKPALDNVWKWLINWDLDLNVQMSSHVAVASAPKSENSSTNSEPNLQEVNTTKDLGVVVDSSFKLSVYCVQRDNKAPGGVLFLMKRSFPISQPTYL